MAAPAAAAVATAAGAADTAASKAMGLLLRNARAPRRMHGGVYLATAFLLLSGVAVGGEGHPAVADLIGGHVVAA